MGTQKAGYTGDEVHGANIAAVRLYFAFRIGFHVMSDQQPILHFSLIIPVFNRPDEVDELLASLCTQTDSGFEVILVEDGSELRCEEVAARYYDRLKLTYHFKPNSGPGDSRNEGLRRMSGNYGIVLDSDCVIPPQYIAAVRMALQRDPVDAFGGPDRAADTFTPVQKAINYAMTSILTTGGIRGGGEKFDRFMPRSFNMGISREAFNRTGGFSQMRFGEDIDMSLRILAAGFRTALFPEAWVYHKRRTSFRQFYKQVYNSGIARINLHLRHPRSLKFVHALPALFVVGETVVLFLGLWGDPSWLVLPIGHTLLLLADALRCTGSLHVALLAVVACYIQLTGYGLGFLHAAWARLVWGRGEFAAFQKKFYH